MGAKLFVMPDLSIEDMIQTIKNSGYAVAILGFLAVCILVYIYKIRYEVEGCVVYREDKKKDYVNILLVLGAAFLIKSVLAVKYAGHGTDMNCFYAWSDMIFDNGISKFYYLDAFTDYPPGYMAILWVVAGIRRLFGIGLTSDAGRWLIKLVPMLADLGTAYLVYLFSKKKFSEGTSLILAGLYALNPLVILDSSIWGQTDSVFTLAVILTCYLCMEEKRIPAYFVYIVGVLIKPQAIMFAPILIYTIIEQVFLKNFNWQKFKKDLIGGLAAIVVMFGLAAPFGLGKVISQYVDTMGSYEYCSINAYNFWAMFGKNWASQNDRFLGIKYSTYGSLAIVAAIALSAWLFFKKMKEDKSKYFVSMAVICSTMFLFSVRMHERYLFPAIVLVLFAFLAKPTREMFFTYVGFSVVCFMNVAHVLYYFVEKDSTGPQGGIIGITALLTMGMYGYLYFAAGRNTQILSKMPAGKKNEKNYIWKRKPVREKAENPKPWGDIRGTVKLAPFSKKDGIALGVIVAVYAAVALINLGNMSAPVTHWDQTEENGGVITLDFGKEQNIDMIHTFLGNYEDRKFMAEVSNDGKNYAQIGEVKATSVFCWNNLSKTEEDADADTYNLADKYRYLRLTSQDQESVLMELVITDAHGNKLMPVNRNEYPELFDEQDEYEATVTFHSGTYFDEIYHARTAYEMIHGLYNYENTHPPLGKYIMSLGIRVFGMNPFGWRIMGTLFGIGMLPFMYFFGRRLFRGKTWAASALTFLFAFDFMHFTQTRIATIDVYGTFFIIAMFFFMYWYSQMNFYDTPLWKTFIPLGLSAVMMGLGCASKWTAVYAAAGLAVFFFAIMGKRLYEYVKAGKEPEGRTAGIEHSYICEVFYRKLWSTLGFCVLFFVLVAGTIYLCSYIPFSDGCTDNVARFEYQLTDTANPVGGVYRGIAEFLENHQNGFTELVGKMVKNANTMYNYHSQLKATHPYSSTWYQWPDMYRPMFYYCQTLTNGLKEGISAFGNPLVWWAGIPAFIFMLYRIFCRKDKTALFISFAYLVQYVPWMLVPRCTFAYHYFPSVPFVCMMIVYIMVLLRQRSEKWFKWILLYLACAFVLFVLFYPVLSGAPVPETFVRDCLRWRESWVLIY